MGLYVASSVVTGYIMSLSQADGQLPLTTSADGLCWSTDNDCVANCACGYSRWRCVQVNTMAV